MFLSIVFKFCSILLVVWGWAWRGGFCEAVFGDGSTM